MQSAEASCNGGGDLDEDNADAAEPITGEACGENVMKDLVTYLVHLH